jgi:hypothetical protein
MKKTQMNTVPHILAAALLLATTSLQAAPVANSTSANGTPNTVQAKDDPYGLAKAGPVMQAGSTAASKSFDQTVMPSLLSFIKQTLPEGVNNTKSKAFEIDPSKLVMTTTADVTATFVYENAGYQNAIGVDAVAPGQKSPQSVGMR